MLPKVQPGLGPTQQWWLGETTDVTRPFAALAANWTAFAAAGPASCTTTVNVIGPCADDGPDTATERSAPGVVARDTVTDVVARLSATAGSGSLPATNAVVSSVPVAAGVPVTVTTTCEPDVTVPRSQVTVVDAVAQVPAA